MCLSSCDENSCDQTPARWWRSDSFYTGNTWWQRLRVLTGRKTHFTKVCSSQQDPVSTVTEPHEIFMLIVAKLPTKEDESCVMSGGTAIETNQDPT